MRRRLTFLLWLATLAIALPAQAQQPVSALTPRPTPLRLVHIKVDGLSPTMVDALLHPDDPEKIGLLPDPEGFRRAVALWRTYTGRQDLLPNLRRYFYEQGVRTENMFSATVTLSAAAWSVIDTGQPTVLKRHMVFSRQNGYLRSHLDGFRDTMEIMMRDARKTNAQWVLDQAGVSVFLDAFHPLRTYVTPQLFYRLRPGEYLKELGYSWLHGGHGFSHPGQILTHHLGRLAKSTDYPDYSEDFVADHLADMILYRDFTGREPFDYLSTIFYGVDHQQHVDPNPENLVYRMMRFDLRVGRIFEAVERSQRREETVIALVSDHGSEWEPGKINLSFPLTRALRAPLFGGHTVATVMAENSARVISNIIPGVEFPRVYESPFSPYGERRGGEEGYVTAFTDNFGNARAEIHLRNNDLNRLHLLLLARRRKLTPEDRMRWEARLRETLEAIRGWLAAERSGYHDYHAGVRDWLPTLKKRKDAYWRDAAVRLQRESERDAVQLRALDRLWELTQAEDPLAWLKKKKPSIPALIPKKYFGPRNSPYQLSHYTIGLDENWNWVETTHTDQGEPVPMNYFEVLTRFRVDNPSDSGEPNPFALVLGRLPVAAVEQVGRAQGWWDDVPVQQALWVLSGEADKSTRGGQALVLEASDGRLRYLPLRHLQPQADGSVELERTSELDPLGLLADPEFRLLEGESRTAWLERFHTPQEWVVATAKTHYSNAVVVFADIMRPNALPFLANPAFQASLTGFSSPELMQRYLRGLRWKYTSEEPELRVWSARLWNFSSKTYTSGGAHGGLPPHVSRVAFYLWGGRGTGLPAGQVLTEPCTTLDVVPTLAAVLHMLDPAGHIVPQPGAVRDRSFLPFPGRVLPLESPGAEVAEASRRKLPAVFDQRF